ncbi:MAG: hypothetical protein GY757_12915, partial [bacterium]|nr:hypothetical protein [bacterium]
PEEILDITREMVERLEGKRIYTDEDEKLQRRYREIFKNHSKNYYQYTSRIGADFLKKNKHLLSLHCQLKKVEKRRKNGNNRF